MNLYRCNDCIVLMQVNQLCTPEVADICRQKLRDHKLSKDPNFCWCVNVRDVCTVSI